MLNLSMMKPSLTHPPSRGCPEPRIRGPLAAMAVLISLLLTLCFFAYGRDLVTLAAFVDPTQAANSNNSSSVSGSATTSLTSSASSASSPSSIVSSSSIKPSSLVNASPSSTTSFSSSAAATSSASSSLTASASCTFCTVPSGHTEQIVPAPPSPLNNTHLSPRWRAAHQKAAAFLSNWTNDEKTLLVTGTGWEIGQCVGNTPDVPSKNWTGLCLEDSPLGVRFADFVSAFPAGINVAATFDKELMWARGYAMGEEFRGKGVHIALGPMTNMGRQAAGGRNWEGFGADPYLSGWATYQTIQGMQAAGVQATVKHYVGNEQEHYRTTSSSNIDDRTLREIYTHPFLRAVQADVASVMCSYNLINGSWACQNSKTLNGVLKTDFGFAGYVMSDWAATESGVLAATNGLDMTMPGDITFNSLTSYFGANLTLAVANGSVAQSRFDDMAQRVVAGWFLLGQDGGYPEVNFDAFRTSEVNNSHVDVQGEHWKVIRHIGASSIVLLKNQGGALPLNKPRTIALIGSDLGPSLKGPNGYSDRGGDDGTLAMGWGSGTCQYPYLVDPLDAISRQARHDHTSLSWWLLDYDLTGAATTAIGAEVAIVGINSDSGEQYITVDGNEGDRNNLTAWHGGDDLVLAVAAVNNNTVVVVHSVGPLILEAWIDHPNVTAVLWAGIPGQESGNALVDILYGSVNPSAKLPYTIAKNVSDYPASINYNDPSTEPQVDYDEGLLIDYRHFQAQGITPRYPFGYGESYTSFEYGNLKVEEREEVGRRYNGTRNDTMGRFLAESLHKPRWTVTVDITNTGPVDGCDIPQLYLSFPSNTSEPPRVLRDFSRINLQPNETQTVGFNLSQYDVSIWDTVIQDWVVPGGGVGVVVANNSMAQGVETMFDPTR